MVTIKMVKDNARTVFSIEGAPEQRDEIAMKLIGIYCGTEPEAVSSITGLAPVPPDTEFPDIDLEPPEPKYQLSFGPYRGMEPDKALATFGETAFVSLCRHLTDDSLDIDPKEREEIVQCCKQWSRNAPARMDDYPTVEAQRKFIEEISVLRICEVKSEGFHNLSDFFENATPEQVKQVFTKTCKKLQERANKI